MLKAADEPSRLSVPAIVASAHVFLLQSGYFPALHCVQDDLPKDVATNPLGQTVQEVNDKVWNK